MGNFDNAEKHKLVKVIPLKQQDRNKKPDAIRKLAAMRQGKKNIIILTTLLLTWTIAHGQTASWVWAKAGVGAGTNYNEGRSVCTDTIGNLYITGSYESPTITFGSYILTNTSAYNDTYIVKYDASGNVIWAKSIGRYYHEMGYSVTTDKLGNIYVAGIFGSASLTIGSFTITNAGSPSSDIFVIKYDGSGNVVWAKSAGGNSSDNAESITSDSFGNIYLTGYYNSPTISFGSYTFTNLGSYNNYVVKYDSFGNVLWAKSYGGNALDVGNGVSSDPFGNVFETGYFSSSTITFGGFTLTKTSSLPDIFIVKYDSSGNVMWAKSAGGTDDDKGSALSSDVSGNVIVTGYFSSQSIIFGTDTLINTNVTNQHYFVAKYDALGNVIWAQEAGIGLGRYAGHAVTTDVTKNIYVAGFMSSYCNFGSIALTPPQYSFDPLFVVKYDSSGNALCASTISSGGDDESGISLDHFGNAYISGDYATTPFIVGSDTLIASGTMSEDVFVAKWRCDGVNAINYVNLKEEIKISPNPFSSLTNLTTNLTDLTVTIYNLYGQQVKQIKTNSKQTVLNRDNLPSGLYLLRVTQDNKIVASDKLVIVDN